MPPLTHAEFATLMAACAPCTPRIAVAVSGGADSLCLAWLARHWGDPFALVVDHGLRPGSADEAGVTARRLAAFGVASLTLRLTDLQPGPGIAARARDARYAALTAACADLGLTDLLLGHHAQDQAETVLMRQAASSGASGLGGMSLVSHRRTLRLVRPLLGVQPARLRATLCAAGLDWVEDPSNTDPAALRTRLRTRLADDGGSLSHRLLASADQAAGARSLAARRIATVLAERASLFPEGYALLTSGPIAPDCLGALVRMLGGRIYPPDTASLARIAAAPGPATLGGVRIVRAGRLGPGLLLVREASAIGPRVAARQAAIWDSRFTLSCSAPLPPEVGIAAVGAGAAVLRRISSLPAVVLQTLPGLYWGNTLCAVPHVGYRLSADAFTGWTNLCVKLTLCPPNPAAEAG